MKQSLSYYITLLVIKLKGLKKDFSKDPIDFEKIRKEDVHHPKESLFKNFNTRTFKISDTLITEIEQKNNSNKLLIFVHGGAFISGPAQHHWDSIKEIAKQTNLNIWMCDYPKSPENKISKISQNLDLVYKSALEFYKSTHVYLIGDSVGGTLVTSLTQRLVKNRWNYQIK